MKLGSVFLEQARTRSDSSAAEANRLLEIGVETAFHKEHNVDDSHSTIRASGSIYERARTAGALGDTIAVPFRPTDYTANGSMTCTVIASNVTNFSYALIGPRMFVDFEIASFTLAGAASTAVQLAIPDGYYVKRTTSNPCSIIDNGTRATGIALVTPYTGTGSLGRVIQVFRSDVANWGTGAGNNAVQGQISFEVRTA